jgi:hypothetical protein
MHHSRDQGVIAEETVLKAQVCGKENMLLRDRNDLNSDPDDLIERLAESLEFYDLTRMAAEALSDAGVRPPESDTGLQRHQPMGDLTEHGGRQVRLKFLAPDPFDQVPAGRPQGRIGGESVNKHIGVDENGFALGYIQ